MNKTYGMNQNTEIYYFSGTGNSYFVAQKLAQQIPNCTIKPIVALMKQPKIITNASKVGFVFPVHALTIPIVVRLFLKKLRFRKTSYLFAITTREGTFFRGFKAINKILFWKFKKLHAQFILEMCNNDPRNKNFISPSTEIIKSKQEIVEKEIIRISKLVIKQKRSKEKDRTDTIGFDMNPFLSWLVEKSILLGMRIAPLIGGVNYFYHDDKCTQCGICEKVCLSGKIKTHNNLPVWEKDTLCYMCYACVNYCPVQSVQVSSIKGVESHTPANGRYSHPYAKVKDIAAQKKNPLKIKQ